jgi:hypothetical protein
MAKPYTVIFYVDGDYHVETFVEHVTADNSHDAFRAATKQAREHGCTSSGRGLPANAYHAATEIVTYAGHLDAVRD